LISITVTYEQYSDESNTINERYALKLNQYSVCGEWGGGGVKRPTAFSDTFVNARMQICCWSYKHSVLSIGRPTLVRIRIDEINIQIVSYKINYTFVFRIDRSSVYTG